MVIIWFKFAVCASVILFAGRRVARYADVIAVKTGLGGLWIGLILVAFATSLPELFTGIGSVVFLNAPDLTVGNLIGANSYNILNIALLDLLAKGAPLLSAISSGQLLAAGFSLIPVTIAAVAITLAANGLPAWSMANIGIFSIAIFVSYCVITKIIYNFVSKGTGPIGRIIGDVPVPRKDPAPRYDNVHLKTASLHYAVAAAIIIASGIWLAYIGKELTGILGLKESFIGNLFLGFVTTLPEVTVSMAALLIGAKEIAVANMLGSNLFNMTVIFIDDILYRKAPILEAVSAGHVRSLCVVMLMTGIIILGIATRPKKKILGMSWYVPLIFAIFLLGAYLNFRMGAK